jgi:hypothetical protein
MPPDHQQHDQQQAPAESVSFKDFLEKVPPSTTASVENLARRASTSVGSVYHRLNLPVLELHCDTDSCAGVRLFERSVGLQTERRPNKRATSHTTRNTKNRIFAIPTAAPAIPPKPSIPAISAIIRNINDQWSMSIPSWGLARACPQAAECKRTATVCFNVRVDCLLRRVSFADGYALAMAHSFARSR